MNDELIVQEQGNRIDMGLIRVDTPEDVLRAGAAVATPLAKFIKNRNLSVRLGNKDYVLAEGFQALGVMMGVTPHEVSVEDRDGIFTATVELRRVNDGKALARASAECGSDDEKDKWGKPTWANRPRYARRSMAITRATAKAGRMAFGWVMLMAGYQATPAEEMQPLHDAGTIDAEVAPVVKATPPPAPKPVSPNDDQLFDDEPPADFDDGPTGLSAVRPIYITKLEKREGTYKTGARKGEKYHQYFIELSDGRKGSFFNGQFGVSAEAAKASNAPVIATFEQQGQYTNLVGLLRAD